MNTEDIIEQLECNKQDMFLIAMSILKDYHDAEDAVSETILTVYEKRKTVRNPNSCRQWIMIILVNKSRYIIKKRKRFVCTDSIENYIQEKVVNNDIWNLVAALDDELQTIVIMFYYQGFKTKEIVTLEIYFAV